jgi:hypothetical protein
MQSKPPSEKVLTLQMVPLQNWEVSPSGITLLKNGLKRMLEQETGKL